MSCHSLVVHMPHDGVDCGEHVVEGDILGLLIQLLEVLSEGVCATFNTRLFRVCVGPEEIGRACEFIGKIIQHRMPEDMNLMTYTMRCHTGRAG